MKYSIEIFPPRGQKHRESLHHLLGSAPFLGAIDISVTCGAGGDGSTEGGEIITDACAAGHAVIAHVVCGRSATETDTVMRAHVDAGVSGLLCLRGDAPAHPEGYGDVTALLRAAGVHGLPTLCAGYPDPHPQSLGARADMEWIRKKADAGAREIITQFCFDADTILRFRDAVHASAPQIRVRPGLLPVKDLHGLLRFAARCGAPVPAGVQECLTGLDPQSGAFRTTSTRISTDILLRLREGGIDHVHVYALNSAALLSPLIATGVLAPKPLTSSRLSSIYAA